MTVKPSPDLTPVPGYPNVYETEHALFRGIDPLTGAETRVDYYHPGAAAQALRCHLTREAIQAAG